MVTGSYDSNPYLNSMIYEVEFPDGQIKEYAANIIAENMLTQVDSDGHSTTMMGRNNRPQERRCCRGNEKRHVCCHQPWTE
jgi:hypothetical protein